MIPCHPRMLTCTATVKDTLQQHKVFLNSFLYKNQIQPALESLAMKPTESNSDPLIMARHAHLREFTQICLALGRGPPTMPIGTAIYLGTDDSWKDGAWPLWTHVVRYVKGCRGVAGGALVEPVEGHENSYLVYVAWESVKDHDDYHHTEHFAKHRIILGLGHQGYREYGHVLFSGGRERKLIVSKL
jgi:hypothetical protein